ncbi:MAG TPA: hypothetical protein VL137_03120 [Polyangiaceae bacterium]|nr:hypothetical protein [Polyangiaceae bacterium]
MRSALAVMVFGLVASLGCGKATGTRGSSAATRAEPLLAESGTESPSRTDPNGEDESRPVPCAQRATTKGEVVELPVPGFRPSVVSLPLPTESLKDESLILAAHGAGDSARSQCEVWREIVGSCGAILCISGTPIGPGDHNGFFFANHLELEKEVLAAVQALIAHFGERIATHDAVYAAYSQGATMGALMLHAHGDLFSRLVLVEGGSWNWTLSRGKQFRDSGGKRILLVCGTTGCNTGAQKSAQVLAKSGLSVRVLDVPGGGHAYWGAVAHAVAKDWPWVIEADDRWR